METMARDGIFGNMEEWIDEYGIGNIRGLLVQDISQFEGSATGVFNTMGSIVERNDVYVDIFFESKLWIVAQMLRL